MTFADRWERLRNERGPLCVGIDPHAELLAAWGLRDDVAGLRTFALRCAEVLGPRVSVVKPQSAFFERHGSAGVAVLEEACAVVRDAGALCLLDVKRGDIGSTLRGYAEAFFRPGATGEVDAVTLSPYLGYESLRPALDLALEHDKGAFVLALTSNPEAAALQGARTPDGASVAGGVLAALRRDNAGEAAGSFGAVVGATVAPEAARAAGGLDVGGPLLSPGFGAQGATVDDLRALFAGVERQAIPATSRAVARCGPDAEALVQAVEQTQAEVCALNG